MVLQIQGVINTVMPVTSGISKAGNQWSKQEFIIETLDQYPCKVCMQIMNERITQFAEQLQAGNKVNVCFDIESREYNGRWYTNCNAFKIEDDRSGGGRWGSQEATSPLQIQADNACPPSPDNDIPF